MGRFHISLPGRLRRTSALTAAALTVSAAALAGGLTGASAASAAVPHVSGSGAVQNGYDGGSYNQCLNAENASGHNPKQNGDPVQLWSCSASAQTWSINTTTGVIKNSVDGLCLDAENDSSHNPGQNGDPVQLWACDGGSQQVWYLPIS